MNDKYDLSLDNRHIVSGLIGAVVVLGAVFVLGVVVGKKVAGDQRAARAQDLLSALDEKVAALEPLHSPTLTFQDELTKKLPSDPLAKPVTAAASAEKPGPPPAPPGQKPDSFASTAREVPRPREVAEDKLGSVKPPRVEAMPGGFTLQLTSAQARADADRFAVRLRQKGYAPFVIEAEVPGRGVWYRVRLGNFSSKESALKFLSDFKRETQLDAFVVAVN